MSRFKTNVLAKLLLAVLSCQVLSFTALMLPGAPASASAAWTASGEASSGAEKGEQQPSKAALQKKFTALKAKYDGKIKSAMGGNQSALNDMKAIHVELVALKTQIDAMP